MAAEPVVHVIDDDETARESLEFLLDCAGLRVQAYESAVAFLKAVPAMEHGCIVTDVRMPEMSGVELIERFKTEVFNEPSIAIRRVLQTGGTFSSSVFWDQMTLFSDVTGAVSTAPNPNPPTASPVIKPFLSGNHFCSIAIGTM